MFIYQASMFLYKQHGRRLLFNNKELMGLFIIYKLAHYGIDLYINRFKHLLFIIINKRRGPFFNIKKRVAEKKNYIIKL